MPVYLDKKSNRYFVKFGARGQSYFKRLPAGMTRRAAAQFEAAWKSKLFLSGYGFKEQKNVLFEDFLAKIYLPFSAKHKKSHLLDVTICKAALTLLKGKNLRDIKPTDIEAFKILRMETPVQKQTDYRIINGKRVGGYFVPIKPRELSTVERELNILSKIFSMAVDNELCDFNPCDKIEKLKYDNRQSRILAVADEERFFAAFQSDWARDVCKFALYTGLRQADCLGLQRFQIDFERNEIRVVQSKTKRAVSIPMNQVVREILVSWIANHQSEYVFPSPRTGTRGLSVKKAVNGAIKRSGIPRLTMRDLRRTAATRLLERGVDALTISRILGHSNLNMISRYAQTDNTLHDAMNSLDNHNKSNVIEFRERKTG